jgi:DNA-binding transcriptional LysR family regulator
MPNKPQDLVKHNCIVPRVGKSVLYDHWEFEYRKKEFEVKVKGNLILNEIEGYLGATLEGLGIAYLPEHFLKEYLDKKLLVKCLENYECEGEGYYLYFPKSRQNEAKLRAFVDHFKFRNK